MWREIRMRGNYCMNFDLYIFAKKMATEGIVSDVGAIYKRLFNHRPNIQNEVHYFVREFETKRGDGDLTTLQDCMRLANETDVVFLEDIMASTPHFRSIREKIAEIGELGNDILEAERTDLAIPQDEKNKLDGKVEEYRQQLQQLQQEQELLDAQQTEKVEKLKEEIRANRDARSRLRAASLSSNTSASISRSSSVEQTAQYSIQNLSYTEDENDDS